MNIKELVLVISILLSIRIAEYAMKKYKEQKDVEVTKKQKSRKQTKKYIITAPSILKVGLPCGIFFGCTTIAFILSQIFKWELDDAIKDLLSLSYELTAPKKRKPKSSAKNPGDFANGKEKETDEG